MPTLLKLLCDTAGMGFDAVVRVTEKTWTACAIRDTINLGLPPGSQLDFNTTLCIEMKASGTPIVIDRESIDPVYCSHLAQAL